MVNNYVVLKFTEECSKEEKTKEMKIMLESLKDKIPVINTLEVNINDQRESNNHDILLFVQTETFEKLKVYSIHPEHEKAIEYFNTVSAGR